MPWCTTSTPPPTGWPPSCPTAAAVYPTHGFGSFCSATQSEASASTIGGGEAANPALTRDEQSFVDDLLAGLDAWPAYYAHMAPANAAGPAAPDLSPPRRADADQIRKRLAAGEWVVDLRNRVAFAAGHVAGTLNFGLDGSFATYLGWLIPWGTPLTLLGETAEQVAEAQRELVRIGIDRPAAHATGSPADWAGAERARDLPRATFADLAQVRHHRPVVVLDVRRNLEWAEAHIDGAMHIPLHELLAPPRRGPRRRGVGALRRRLPGLHRRVHPGRRRPARRRRRRRLRPGPRRRDAGVTGLTVAP